MSYFVWYRCYLQFKICANNINFKCSIEMFDWLMQIIILLSTHWYCELNQNSIRMLRQFAFFFLFLYCRFESYFLEVRVISIIYIFFLNLINLHFTVSLNVCACFLKDGKFPQNRLSVYNVYDLVMLLMENKILLSLGHFNNVMIIFIHQFRISMTKKN